MGYGCCSGKSDKSCAADTLKNGGKDHDGQNKSQGSKWQHVEKITALVSFIGIVLSVLNWDFWLPFDAAWFAVVLNGGPIIKEAVVSLFKYRKITSSLLVGIAIIAACIVGEVFAAAEVAFLMAVGGMLEGYTIRRARKDMEALLEMQPETARVLEADASGVLQERIISASEVAVGARIRVFPGETVPVDGVIVHGESSFNEAALTGEPIPVDRGIGETVLSGARNSLGAVEIECTKEGSNSTLQRLIKLVEEAEGKKAVIERIVDKWAGWLVPAALITAIVVWLVSGDIIRGITILVVFCPCALMLATPTAIVAAIGNATRKGVIIRSGSALELLSKVDVITFDKTGTLTHGKPTVESIVPLNSSFSAEELLGYAQGVESYSEHPLARAIVQYAKEKNVQAQEVKDFKSATGFGAKATVSGKEVQIGNHKYLKQVAVQGLDTLANLANPAGQARVYIAVDSVFAGYVAFADVIRAEAKEVIASLQESGIETVLLTGDKKEVADNLVKQLGIKQVFADLLPEDKMQVIGDLQKNHIVCMVGDGINDAPALKKADVGVAMGGIGSDIAIEAADAVLLHENLGKISYLMKLARRTVTIIKINITLSLALNLAAVVLAAFGMLGPVLGALVHNIGAVLVVLNASRLLVGKEQTL